MIDTCPVSRIPCGLAGAGGRTVAGNRRQSLRTQQDPGPSCARDGVCDHDVVRVATVATRVYVYILLQIGLHVYTSTSDANTTHTKHA